MGNHSFKLDDSLAWFVELGRIDPITRAPYRRGDRVVVCASCKMVHLETTWRDCGGCVAPGCNGKTTAKRFIPQPPPRPTVPEPALNRIRLTNHRVERMTDATTTDESGQPRIVVKARHNPT